MPTPYAMFRATLDSGDLCRAIQLARALGTVRLDDALSLVAQLRDESATRYEAACVRWVSRYAIESDDVTLDELRAALDALDLLRVEPETATGRLRALCAARGIAVPSADETALSRR